MAAPHRTYVMIDRPTGKTGALVRHATSPAHAARAMARDMWEIRPATAEEALDACERGIPVISARETPAVEPVPEPEPEPPRALAEPAPEPAPEPELPLAAPAP